MVLDQVFYLDLQFGNTKTHDTTIIRLENVKITEVFQHIKASSPDFPHSESLINQYVETMKRQEIHKTIKLLVPDGRFKLEDYYMLISTRIK
jgi:hypothetical protein